MGISWNQERTQVINENAAVRAASGCVRIRCDSTVKAGKTICSDWIDTGLGAGYAVVETALLDENGFDSVAKGPYLIFGRPDFFENSKFGPSVPDVRTAVSYDTDSGKFRLALRFKDSFERGEFSIQWTAMRVEKSETAPSGEEDFLFYIVNPPKTLHPGWHYTLKTNRSDDSVILWSVSEGCGTIDASGDYQAPDAAGMYEVTARLAGTEHTATCYMIVRE